MLTNKYILGGMKGWLIRGRKKSRPQEKKER